METAEILETQSLSRSERRIYERQRRDAYVNARIEGETPHAAALEAGYTPMQASNATRVLEPKVQKAIHEHLASAGGDNERLATVIVDALSATRTTKYGTEEDHHTRLGAVRLAAELSGQLKRDTNISLGVQINLPAAVAERFAAFTAQPTVSDIIVGNPEAATAPADVIDPA